MRVRFQLCALAPVVFALVLGLSVPMQVDAKERAKPPPSRKTQVISQKVFEKLDEAQKDADAKNFAKALATLDELKKNWSKLNDYEKAMLWNFYAGVYYGMENLPKTLEAYANILKQDNVPEGLRNTSLYAIAQLYLVSEQYQKALDALAQWFKYVDEPRPDAYMLRAQALYQMGRFAQAEEPILEAMKLAKSRDQRPKESWLSLLLAVYFEQEKYERAAKVLELMVALYPKPSYYRQLAGIYGLLDREVDRTAVTRAAYEAGMLTKEADILNLARIYLSQEAPYAAIKVLRSAFKNESIKEDKDSLKLYAQALAFGQEHEAQIPILEKLAKLTGDGEHYIYLGQALTDLARWTDAAKAYRSALNDKNLDRPGNAWINVGTSLYNADQLEEARDAFRKATKYERSEKQARNWINFINKEIERKEFLSQY